MEDSTTSRPIAIEAACLKEPIAFLEEEMIINQLLLVLRAHGSKGIESTLEITIKVVASVHDILHNSVAIGI